MKTLKFFIALGILGVFTLGNANAQSQKEVFEYTEYGCLGAEYAGEVICGDVHLVITLWDGRVHAKVTGTQVGQDSGDIYKVNETDNGNTKSVKEGSANNDKYVLTMILKKKGAPAIVCHYQYHITINANGEVAIEFEKYFQSNW